MDVNWRMRIMIFTVLALMLFGDFFGYGSIVRGVNSNPNQAAAAAAQAVAQGPPVVAGHRSSSGAVQAAAAGGPASGTGSGKYQHKDAEIEINAEDADLDEISAAALKNRRHLAKTQLSDTIKESCLPKMLCEMASKPDYMLTEKERDLLHLIRASTLSLAMNGTPSKWHFAAHMGELLRYTGDSMSGPMGCANLWPSCPISSKKLMKLSYKVKI